MYEGDWLLPRLVRASAFVTSRPEEADLFLIPIEPLHMFHNCSLVLDANVTTCREFISNFLIAVAQQLSSHAWWRRRHGTDHLIVWPQGAAGFAFDRGAAHVGNATFLGNQGSRCFDGRPALTFVPGRDVVLPYTVPFVHTPGAAIERVLNVQHLLPCRSKEFLFVSRTTLFEAGEYSSCVRQLLHALYAPQELAVTHPGFVQGGVDGHVIVGMSADSDQFANEMMRSYFCLCPEGWWPWTPRPLRAVALGCIPVIISDSLQLPAETWLDWSTFSVRLSPAAVRADPLLVERTLRQFSYEQIGVMQRMLTAVSDFLLWYQNPALVLDWVLGESLLAARTALAAGYSRPPGATPDALHVADTCVTTLPSLCTPELSAVAAIISAHNV